ncbi:hypothetical protein BGZ54_007125 [Gamsiella multidivaricata]|nr:hypothetical protein BGZ54_007125 [Gamsiella multidivaricata]
MLSQIQQKCAAMGNNPDFLKLKREIQARKSFVDCIVRAVDRLGQTVKENPNALQDQWTQIFELKDIVVDAMIECIPWSSPRWGELQIAAQQIVNLSLWNWGDLDASEYYSAPCSLHKDVVAITMSLSDLALFDMEMESLYPLVPSISTSPPTDDDTAEIIDRLFNTEILDQKTKYLYSTKRALDMLQERFGKYSNDLKETDAIFWQMKGDVLACFS